MIGSSSSLKSLRDGWLERMRVEEVNILFSVRASHVWSFSIKQDWSVRDGHDVAHFPRNWNYSLPQWIKSTHFIAELVPNTCVWFRGTFSLRMIFEILGHVNA